MPSAALTRWQTDRTPRLAEVEAQCAASLLLVPPRPNLVEENLRASVLLLSAHFQGYCRDLYSECSQIVVARVRATLREWMLTQFSARRKLAHGNPSIQNIREAFERFGFTLDLPSA